MKPRALLAGVTLLAFLITEGIYPVPALALRPSMESVQTGLEEKLTGPEKNVAADWQRTGAELRLVLEVLDRLLSQPAIQRKTKSRDRRKKPPEIEILIQLLVELKSIQSSLHSLRSLFADPLVRPMANSEQMNELPQAAQGFIQNAWKDINRLDDEFRGRFPDEISFLSSEQRIYQRMLFYGDESGWKEIQERLARRGWTSPLAATAGLEELPAYPLPEKGLGEFEHESHLSRHRLQWKLLRENALPDLIQRATERAEKTGELRLHTLVLGASTGEELARAFHEIVTWLGEHGYSVATDPEDKTGWQIIVSGIERDKATWSKGQSKLRGESPFFWTTEPDELALSSEDYALQVVGTLNRYRSVARRNLRLYHRDLRDSSVARDFPDADLVIMNHTLYQLIQSKEIDSKDDLARLDQQLDASWPEAWITTNEGSRFLLHLAVHHKFIDVIQPPDFLPYTFGRPNATSPERSSAAGLEERDWGSQFQRSARMLQDRGWFLNADSFTAAFLKTEDFLRQDLATFEQGARRLGGVDQLRRKWRKAMENKKRFPPAFSAFLEHLSEPVSGNHALTVVHWKSSKNGYSATLEYRFEDQPLRAVLAVNRNSEFPMLRIGLSRKISKSNTLFPIAQVRIGRDRGPADSLSKPPLHLDILITPEIRSWLPHEDLMPVWSINPEEDSAQVLERFRKFLESLESYLTELQLLAAESRAQQQPVLIGPAAGLEEISGGLPEPVQKRIPAGITNRYADKSYRLSYGAEPEALGLWADDERREVYLAQNGPLLFMDWASAEQGGWRQEVEKVPGLLWVRNLLSSELGQTGLAVHTHAAVAAVRHAGPLEGMLTVESGAGYGIPSLVAKKEQGASFAVLLEEDPISAGMARLTLKDNDLVEGKDFLVIETDIRNIDEIARQLEALGRKETQVALISNLGDWHVYSVNNQSSMRLIPAIEGATGARVTRFIGGGYVLKDGESSNGALQRDLTQIQQEFGFTPDPSQVRLVDPAHRLESAAWVARRPATAAGLEEDAGWEPLWEGTLQHLESELVKRLPEWTLQKIPMVTIQAPGGRIMAEGRDLDGNRKVREADGILYRTGKIFTDQIFDQVETLLALDAPDGARYQLWMNTPRFPGSTGQPMEIQIRRKDPAAGLEEGSRQMARGESQAIDPVLSEAVQGPGVVVLEAPVLRNRPGLLKFIENIRGPLARRLIVVGLEEKEVQELRERHPLIQVIPKEDFTGLVLALVGLEEAEQVTQVGENDALAERLRQALPLSMSVVHVGPDAGLEELLRRMGVPDGVLDQINASGLEETLARSRAA